MTKSYFRIFTSRSKQLLMFLAISPVIMTSCSKEELPQVTTDLPATGNWDPKSQLNDIFKKNEYTLNMNLANSEKVKGGNGREYSISGFINDRIYLALTPEPNQTGLVADTTYLRPLQTLGLAYDVDFVKTTPGTYVFTVTEFQRENNQSHILIKMGQKKITIRFEKFELLEDPLEHIEISSGAPYPLADILHSSCRSDVYFKSSLNENQGNIINGSLHLNAHVNFSLNAYKQYDNGQYKLTKRFFKQGPANTSMFAVENQSVVKL